MLPVVEGAPVDAVGVHPPPLLALLLVRVRARDRVRVTVTVTVTVRARVRVRVRGRGSVRFGVRNLAAARAIQAAANPDPDQPLP